MVFMKFVVGVCCLMFVNVLFGQSKKEMIAILNNRVDSLNQVVSAERSEKQKLNSEISSLKRQLGDLESTKDDLTEKLITMEEKNATLTADYDKQSSALNVVEQKIKVKEDSLMLLATELLKYKPAPKEKLVVKQDNTGPIKSVTIGTQVWMVSNLNVSTFSNGVEIPEVQDKAAWEKAGDNKQPAWCYYNNDPKNGVKYGKLYNWYAVVDSNGLCPQGWHVPSDKECETLVSYLGENPGTKMKAKSGWDKWESGGSATCPVCSGWNDEYRRKTACHRCKDTRRIPAAVVYHSGDGNNLSGFTGLPGGYRFDGGGYGYVGSVGLWWSSSEDNTANAWGRYLKYNYGNAYRDASAKDYGFSVRCLRD
jgi:uncharacterized protein (TIGR02145 family)